MARWTHHTQPADAERRVLVAVHSNGIKVWVLKLVNPNLHDAIRVVREGGVEFAEVVVQGFVGHDVFKSEPAITSLAAVARREKLGSQRSTSTTAVK